MFIKQKAQGIVEFAIILPLFLLLSIGIIYFGMAYSDYLTMSNTVRTVAHESSLRLDDDGYAEVIDKYTKNVALTSDIYIWNPKQDTTVVFVPADSYVVTTTTARFNQQSAIGSVIANILSTSIGDEISITYSMYTTRTQ